jgi:hypothetical protein
MGSSLLLRSQLRHESYQLVDDRPINFSKATIVLKFCGEARGSFEVPVLLLMPKLTSFLDRSNR